jgi:hypothetical protein
MDFLSCGFSFCCSWVPAWSPCDKADSHPVPVWAGDIADGFVMSFCSLVNSKIWQNHPACTSVVCCSYLSWKFILGWQGSHPYPYFLFQFFCENFQLRENRLRGPCVLQHLPAFPSPCWCW